MDKMTNKKALLYVKENFTTMPTDVAEKIDAMILTLEKKSASRKPTKVQEENEKLKNIIADALTDEGKTVSEIISLVPELTGFNTQKVTPLLYALEGEGRAKKVSDKKKTLFVAVA